MRRPKGEVEPAQTRAFDASLVVLAGLLVVGHEGGRIEIRAGEAVDARPGEWVRFNTPEPGGAKDVAGVPPAFS